jgi:hypothetical protein
MAPCLCASRQQACNFDSSVVQAIIHHLANPAQMCILDGNAYDAKCLEAGVERDDDLDSCSLLLNNKSTPLLQPGGSGSHTPDNKVLVQLSVRRPCRLEPIGFWRRMLHLGLHIAGWAAAPREGICLRSCPRGRHGVWVVQRGMAQLPDLHVSDSSEAMLSGRKPPFRLLVRAVHTEGRRLAIRHAVSEGFVVSGQAVSTITSGFRICFEGCGWTQAPFCSRHVPEASTDRQPCLDAINGISKPAQVATRRTRTAGKVEIPNVDDHVSKLEHMGKETVKKLQDIHGAAIGSGIDISVPTNCINKGASANIQTLQRGLRNFSKPLVDVSGGHVWRSIEQGVWCATMTPCGVTD